MNRLFDLDEGYSELPGELGVSNGMNELKL